MSPSSRTPEGIPNRCPICGGEVVVEPSLFFGDAACPKCGTLLWFLRTGEGARFRERRDNDPIHERVIAMLAERLNVDASRVEHDLDTVLNEAGLDSIDVIDIVMEIEEEAA